MRELFVHYVQLFVRTPTQSVVTLNDIDTRIEISDLKSQLELHTGIIAEVQTLLLNDIRLQNGKTLEECNIKRNSFLRLRLKESSLEQIYVDAVQGKTEEVFKLGVQLIEQEDTKG